MPTGTEKKIIRLLGVGFDTDDGHIRISQGDRFDVIMGSAECHEYIRTLIQEIEQAMDERGMCLNDLTPKAFTELVETLI